MAKKQGTKKTTDESKNGSSKDGKQIVEVREPQQELVQQAPTDSDAERQHSEQVTEGTSDCKKKEG